MGDKIFFDTNVILYSKDAGDAQKQRVADERILQALEDDSFVISSQVINELYVNLTQKLRPGLPSPAARLLCRSLATSSCEPVTIETADLAWELQDRFSLSWWDSLIVASAKLASCSLLLCEDLQHGLVMDELLVENPFRET